MARTSTAGSASVAKLFALLKELKSVQGWIVKAATAGPIVQYLSGWGPPWPERQLALALGCAVLQVIAAMWAVTFWSKRSKKAARRAFAGGTLAFLALGSAYVYFFAYDTLYVPLNGERVVLGRDFQPDKKEFIDEVYGGDLADAIHDLSVEGLYELPGLARNRIRLCLLFFAMYLALSVGMTAYAAIGGRPTRAAKKGASAPAENPRERS
jgi:hypothetical protein